MTDSTEKPTVSNVVEMAKKPAGKKSKDSGGKGFDKPVRFGEFGVENGQFVQYRMMKVAGSNDRAENSFALCNFTCKVVEEVLAQDDLADSSFLRIEGRRQDGLALPLIEVPIKAFNAPQNWVADYWGLRPVIYPGVQKERNLKVCIQLFSQLAGDIPRRVVYKCTGWKRIDGKWHYLTGSGAITSDGLINDVQVDMGAGHMSRYQLPAPLQGDKLKQAFADMRLLLDICPGKPHIGAALFAAIVRAPLGECKPTDFALWLHGLTGSRKSAIAAIAQSFFGEFHDRSFPANWSDSANDAEMKAHQCKDGIFTIDDFKPSISKAEADKLHAMAERLVRNTGNQAGRGRRGADMQAKAAPFNRSMMIITGEDLPRGQSLLGRLLILELNRNDVDNATLTKLQQAAAGGTFSGLMAGYIQWLASRLDQLKAEFPMTVQQLRDAAIRDGFASSHPRAPELFSNLVAAPEFFCDYLLDVNNITDAESNELQLQIESGLKDALSEQAEYQQEQCEVERFLELVRSVLSSGNGHIANTLDKGPPKVRPYSWGWRDAGSDVFGDKQHKPCGDCIGWYQQSVEDKPDEIWLDPNSAFKAAQQFAKAQSEPFFLSASSLWRRMSDRNLLLADEKDAKGGKPRTQVKRRINGEKVKRRVVVLAAELIESG